MLISSGTHSETPVNGRPPPPAGVVGPGELPGAPTIVVCVATGGWVEGGVVLPAVVVGVVNVPYWASAGVAALAAIAARAPSAAKAEAERITATTRSGRGRRWRGIVTSSR